MTDKQADRNPAKQVSDNVILLVVAVVRGGVRRLRVPRRRPRAPSSAASSRSSRRGIPCSPITSASAASAPPA